MTHLDDTMRADLTALGDATARAIPDYAWTAAQINGAAGPYRDERPGAEARRNAAREAWLRELALMPLASERIFVHRVSRAAAGAVALLGVAFAVLTSLDLWAQRLLHALIGQPTAPLTGALLGGAVMAAYVFAGLIAERYYERHLRRHLGAADDPELDPRAASEHLAATGPEAHTRALIDRVDAAAIALPLAGVTGVGLLAGLLFFFSDPGYSAIALVAEAQFVLVKATALGVIVGVALAVACAREHRAVDRSALLRAAEHWLTLAAGVTAILVALWYAARVAFGLHAFGIIPDGATSIRLGAFGVVALIVPTAWLLLRLRRREHRRLGDD
ncbi:MAG TPA: hypothetical protein VML75_14560 [Kofleriaceae bacterium]|nr:hypothetical protein [Kofleriaceae bacterium]